MPVISKLALVLDIYSSLSLIWRYSYCPVFQGATSAGIVLISLLGWLVSGQKLDFPAIAGMILICAGVLVINIFSKSSLH
nr:hypothetical protein [Citrobacter sp. RHBSTW-00535]